MSFIRPFHRILIFRTKSIVSQLSSLRWLNIRVEETPNENALKFIPEGRKVMGHWRGLDFNQTTTVRCPLAKQLFLVAGVSSVFYGPDFITITKKQQQVWNWKEIKPKIVTILSNFFDEESPKQTSQKTQTTQTEALTREAEEEARAITVKETKTIVQEKSSSVIGHIKEIIDQKIRPVLLEDGGDIDFEGFNDSNGRVTIRFLGSCNNCASSDETLRNGIENMLKYFVPEVKELIAINEPHIITKADMEQYKELVSKSDKKIIVENQSETGKEIGDHLDENKEKEETCSIVLNQEISQLQAPAEKFFLAKELVNKITEITENHIEAISIELTNPNLSEELKKELDNEKDAFKVLGEIAASQLQAFFDDFNKQNEDLIKMEDLLKIQVGIIKNISADALNQLDQILMKLEKREIAKGLIEEIKFDREIIQTITKTVENLENVNEFEMMINNLKKDGKDYSEYTNDFLEIFEIKAQKIMESKNTQNLLFLDSERIYEEFQTTLDLIQKTREENLRFLEKIKSENNLDIEKEAFVSISDQSCKRLERIIKKFEQSEDLEGLKKEIELEQEMINLINATTKKHLEKIQNELKLKDQKEQMMDKKDETQTKSKEEEEILNDLFNKPTTTSLLPSITITSTTKEMKTSKENDEPIWKMQNSALNNARNNFFINQIKPAKYLQSGAAFEDDDNDRLNGLIDEFLVRQKEQWQKDLGEIKANEIGTEIIIKTSSNNEMTSKEDNVNENIKKSMEEKPHVDFTSVIEKYLNDKNILENIREKVKQDLENSMIHANVFLLIQQQNDRMEKLMHILNTWCKEQRTIGKVSTEEIEDIKNNNIREKKELHDKKDKKKRGKHEDGKENKLQLSEPNEFYIKTQMDLMKVKNSILELPLKSQLTTDKEIRDLYEEIGKILNPRQKNDEPLNLKKNLLKIRNDLLSCSSEMTKHHPNYKEINKIYIEIGEALKDEENCKLKQKEENEDIHKTENHPRLLCGFKSTSTPLVLPNFAKEYLQNFSQMIILLETECHNLAITMKEFEELLAEGELELEKDEGGAKVADFGNQVENLRVKKRLQEHQLYLANVVLDGEKEFLHLEKHVNEMKGALAYLDAELRILNDTAKGTRNEFESILLKLDQFLKSKDKIFSYLPYAKMIVKKDLEKPSPTTTTTTTTATTKPIRLNDANEGKGKPINQKANYEIDMDKICKQAVNAKKEFDNKERLKKLKNASQANNHKKKKKIPETRTKDVEILKCSLPTNIQETNEKVNTLFELLSKIDLNYNPFNDKTIKSPFRRYYFYENNSTPANESKYFIEPHDLGKNINNKEIKKILISERATIT